MAAVTICSDFGAPQNKVCHCFHFSPSICHEVMGLDTMILVFWMLSFKPNFSLSNPEYSLEGLVVKLELQYFGHMMWRANSLEKILMLGKIDGGENDRGWDGWMASPAQWTWVWVSSGRWWRTGKPGVRQSMGSQKIRHEQATEQQQGDSDGQRSLVYYSSKGCKELDTT